MPRNWQHTEGYLDRLAKDVYPEPITKNHRAITIKSFRRFVLPHREQIKDVLDVGCGQGVALDLFRDNGMKAIGVTLSEEDVRVCPLGVSWGFGCSGRRSFQVPAWRDRFP